MRLLSVFPIKGQEVNSIALSSGLIFPSWFRSNILPNIPFIAAPPLIVHVFIVIGFAGKQDIFTIYQSHVTITRVKTFRCQRLHFFEFYVLIFFDGYSVYQQMGYKNPCSFILLSFYVKRPRIPLSEPFHFVVFNYRYSYYATF